MKQSTTALALCLLLLVPAMLLGQENHPTCNIQDDDIRELVASFEFNELYPHEWAERGYWDMLLRYAQEHPEDVGVHRFLLGEVYRMPLSVEDKLRLHYLRRAKQNSEDPLSLYLAALADKSLGRVGWLTAALDAVRETGEEIAPLYLNVANTMGQPFGSDVTALGGFFASPESALARYHELCPSDNYTLLSRQRYAESVLESIPNIRECVFEHECSEEGSEWNCLNTLVYLWEWEKSQSVDTWKGDVGTLAHFKNTFLRDIGLWYLYRYRGEQERASFMEELLLREYPCNSYAPSLVEAWGRAHGNKMSPLSTKMSVEETREFLAFARFWQKQCPNRALSFISTVSTSALRLWIEGEKQGLVSLGQELLPLWHRLSPYFTSTRRTMFLSVSPDYVWARVFTGVGRYKEALELLQREEERSTRSEESFTRRWMNERNVEMGNTTPLQIEVVYTGRSLAYKTLRAHILRAMGDEIQARELLQETLPRVKFLHEHLQELRSRMALADFWWEYSQEEAKKGNTALAWAYTSLALALYESEPENTLAVVGSTVARQWLESLADKPVSDRERVVLADKSGWVLKEAERIRDTVWGGTEWKKLEKPVPFPASFKDVEGNTHTVGDGKVAVFLWASWCIPCLKELPAVLEAREPLKEYGGFETLVLNVDKHPELGAQKALDGNELKDVPIVLGHEFFREGKEGKERMSDKLPQIWLVEEGEIRTVGYGAPNAVPNAVSGLLNAVLNAPM